MSTAKSALYTLILVLSLLFTGLAGSVQAFGANANTPFTSPVMSAATAAQLVADDGLAVDQGTVSELIAADMAQLSTHTNGKLPPPLLVKTLGSQFHQTLGDSQPLSKDITIPRSLRWQVLQSQWQRDFSPEYQLVFELALPEAPELQGASAQPRPVQALWVLKPRASDSLKPGGWKDTNLQFRFIQQASSLA